MDEKLTIRQQMDAFKAYIPYLDDHGINETILAQIINEHKPIRREVEMLQKRYDTTDVPIMKRPIIELPIASENMKRIDQLINNKLNNAFDADVVDTKVGYFLGHPINYVVEKESLNFKILTTTIDEMRIRENMPAKDTSTGIQTSIAGYGARLVYWSEDNGKQVLRVSNVNPAECIFLYHENMHEPSYSIQYYSTTRIKADGTKMKMQVAEFHDKENTWFFESGSSGFELVDVIPHYLLNPPLFGVENNDALQGEASKILALVDAYDRTMSDANSEVEATRLAILILRNIGMDDEDIQELNKSGALELWGNDSDVKYLTKDVNDSMIEHLLDRLDENITRFAKSVNFNDEAFAGNISGIAMRFKIFALEFKTILAEQRFRSALTYQFKLLCAGWSLLNICSPDDYLKIWFGFKRNLPSNLKEEAEIQSILQGRVSERTRLSLFSQIDDVEAELEAMKQEKTEFQGEFEDLKRKDIDDSDKNEETNEDE
ncbi:phage portal protein [Lysinibacillus sp. FSL K6-1151]|uniref:phage portal protein n=1 Tax=Lysinibacillus sp. FSL K6-1151 TaxID=2921465 RepID=UPI00315A6A0B